MIQNSITQQTCAVDDGQHVYLIRLYPVDYTVVRRFDDLTDIFSAIFRNFAAEGGMSGDLHGAASDFVHIPFAYHI